MIHASLPIIVALIALFAVGSAPATPTALSVRLATFYGSLAMPVVAVGMAAVVARVGVCRNAATRAQWLSRMRVIAAIAELALTVAFVKNAVEGNLVLAVGEASPFAGAHNARRLVSVLPFAVALVLVRLGVYVTQSPHPPAYRAFVAFQLKLCAIPVAPTGLFLLATDLFEFAPLSVRLFAVTHPSLPFLGLFLAMVVVASRAPMLLRWLWKTEPLENPDLQDRMRQIAGRHGIAFRRVSVWFTRGLRIANAAVAGILPKTREVFVTDWLLKRMNDDEVEGVLAHELGHIRHRHLVYYLLFSVSYFVAYIVVFDQASRWAPAVFRGSALGPVISVVAFFYLYFVILLGYISREFERQADYFAIRNASVPMAYLSVLRRLAESNSLPLRVRSLFEWSRSHPSIARRIEFAERAIADDPAVARFGRTLWVAKALVVSVPICVVIVVFKSDGVFGSRATILQSRAAILLQEVERLRSRYERTPEDAPEALAIRLEAANLNGMARDDLETSLALEPGTSEVLYLYGLTGVYAQRRELADRAFRDALALDPNHTGALYALSSLYADRQEWIRARHYLDLADAATPDNAQIAELRRSIEAREAATRTDEEP